MKCFVPLNEEAILALWIKNPALVAPFSKPFYPSALMEDKRKQVDEVSSLLKPSSKSR